MKIISTPKPTIKQLKAIPIFAPLNDEELSQILEIGTTEFFEPHASIVIEGELSWGIHFILDGQVGIYKTNKITGEVYEMGDLRTGGYFGELSLVDENSRSATVIALVETVTYYISKDIFFKFLEDYLDTKIKFLSGSVRTLAALVRELDDNYLISQYQLWDRVFSKDGSNR